MTDKMNPEFRTSRGYQIINQQEGQLSSAMEDYLEMIYRFCCKDGYTRVGKLSEGLHVKPSSASKMIFKLADMGYIKYDRYEIVQLTDIGKENGAYLLLRHNIVEEFLQFIGSENALEETELIEHSLSPSTIKSVHTLLEFFKSNDQTVKDYQQYNEKAKKEVNL